MQKITKPNKEEAEAEYNRLADSDTITVVAMIYNDIDNTYEINYTYTR